MVYANALSALSRNVNGASSNKPIQTRIFSGVVLLIPGNMEQVVELEELITLFWYQILDLPKLILLYKTLKAARLSMANRMLLNYTNTELLTVNTQKKRRVQRTGILYNDQSACVLSLEDVEKRRQVVENRRKDIKAKKL